MLKDMQQANAAAYMALNELDRNPNAMTAWAAKKAVAEHKRTIEEFEIELATRRVTIIIFFVSSLLAFILGVITYQYVKR
jgi:acyl CoA:acetate/3-ketoacid CoA transferase alpha subunit